MYHNPWKLHIQDRPPVQDVHLSGPRSNLDLKNTREHEGRILIINYLNSISVIRLHECACGQTLIIDYRPLLKASARQEVV